MQWLSPMTAIYAAAVSVPLLLLLYFLKLKRQERIISSTFLWRRAVQDLQVNAPFQRIRRNLLLFLQLLMLAAILLALAGPVLSLTAGPGKRYVLLIDRSASMNANDIKPSRLESAKKQSKEFVESMRGASFFSLTQSGDQAMVIAFSNHARVMCNFTSDKHQLNSAIDAIENGDGSSHLSEAVRVARAFAQPVGLEDNKLSAGQSAQLMLFSDGHIRDSDRVILNPGEINFNCIGRSNDNVAVTAMQAKRSYEKPQQVNVFVTIANYGNDDRRCDVQLSMDSNVRALRRVNIPARIKGTSNAENQSGKVSLNFSLEHSDAAVVEIRVLADDRLDSDNSAWSILSPPGRLSVLLVSRGNAILESALRACPLAGLDTMSPAEFENMDHSLLSVEQPYDVIVLDGYVPEKPARCRYLVFGKPPPQTDVKIGKELKEQIIIDWRSRHPVLRYVNLGNLFVSDCYQLEVPRNAEVLAEFNEGPAIILARHGGSIFLVAAFNSLESNWPFEPSFVLFLYNSLNFLGTEAGRNRVTGFRAGEPIAIEGLPSDTFARIDGPEGYELQVKTTEMGSVHFPSITLAGIYTVNIAGREPELFSVNLLDKHESNIEPVREIVFSGASVQAGRTKGVSANLLLWPFIVGITLILACLEWFVYNSKARI